jgi:hypothetical protein
MKENHQFFHAHETTKHFNNIVTSIENCIALLMDSTIGGEQLNETLDNLKLWTEENCDSIFARFGLMSQFINEHKPYDLLRFSNKAHFQILADKLASDQFTANLKVAIKSPAIKNKSKLGDISIQVVSPISYVAPVVLELGGGYQYCAIINDRHDAASYTLRGIHQNTGEPLIGWTDEQKRSEAKRFLGRIERLRDWKFPLELQDDAAQMVSVYGSVMAMIDSEDVLVTADYIDANVEKLPLMRRSWALG